jgi:hypothetical protein
MTYTAAFIHKMIEPPHIPDSDFAARRKLPTACDNQSHAIKPFSAFKFYPVF